MIESLENKRVKEWTKLNQKKYRITTYLTSDITTIMAAREKGVIETLIYSGDLPFSFENSIEVSSAVLYKICEKKEGYCAVIKKEENSEFVGNRILLLDELQDPLNVGILIHNAKEFGYKTIVLSENTADIYHEKALMESKGAHHQINLCRRNIHDTIKALKEKGYHCYATGLWQQTKNLKSIEPQEKMAFVMGNEGSGVRQSVMELCEESVKIEMQNIDSLNVAIAGSIIMYSFPEK